MEWHENLAGRNNLGKPEFHSGDAAAAADDVYPIVRSQRQAFSVARIHFEPGARRQILKHGNFSGFRARVCQCSTVLPVLKTNGYSELGCSGNGSHFAHTRRARPSEV
jgi:hypothetical protein